MDVKIEHAVRVGGTNLNCVAFTDGDGIDVTYPLEPSPSAMFFDWETIFIKNIHLADLIRHLVNDGKGADAWDIIRLLVPSLPS